VLALSTVPAAIVVALLVIDGPALAASF